MTETHEKALGGDEDLPRLRRLLRPHRHGVKHGNEQGCEHGKSQCGLAAWLRFLSKVEPNQLSASVASEGYSSSAPTLSGSCQNSDTSISCSMHHGFGGSSGQLRLIHCSRVSGRPFWIMKASVGSMRAAATRCGWRRTGIIQMLRGIVGRLMERHGDAKLTDLLQTLANCQKARSASIHDRCKAVFEQLPP